MYQLNNDLIFQSGESTVTGVIDFNDDPTWMRDVKDFFRKERERDTRNIYCPTGIGGGIDPTCKAGGVGGGGVAVAGGYNRVLTESVDKKAVDADGNGKVTLNESLLYLSKQSGLNIDFLSADMSDADKDAMASMLAGDIELAYSRSGRKDAGWYSDDIKKTFELMTQPPLNHKELKEGDTHPGPPPVIRSAEDHAFIFAAALALTSPRADVLYNGRDAEFIYKQWKETNKLFSERGFSSAQGALPQQMEAVQAIIDKHGLSTTRELMSRMVRVGDLNAKNSDTLGGVTIAGKKPTIGGNNPADAVVPIFSIFGPKVGAFFANVSGNPGPVTIDMWEMRHLGIISGDPVFVPTQGSMRSKAVRLLSVFKRDDVDLHGLDKDKIVKELQEMNKNGLVIEGSEVSKWAKAQSKIYSKSEGPHPKTGEWKTSYGDKTEVNLAANDLHERGRLIPRDAPRTTTTVANVRDIFQRAAAIVQKKHPDLEPAEMQALSWYHTQRLMKATHANVAIDTVDENGRMIEKTFSSSIERLIDGSTDRRTGYENMKKAKDDKAKEKRAAKAAEKTKKTKSKKSKSVVENKKRSDLRAAMVVSYPVRDGDDSTIDNMQKLFDEAASLNDNYTESVVSILEAVLSGEIPSFSADGKIVENVFCPTGPGGGIDPTCSKGGGTAVLSSKEKENNRLARSIESVRIYNAIITKAENITGRDMLDIEDEINARLAKRQRLAASEDDIPSLHAARRMRYEEAKKIIAEHGDKPPVWASSVYEKPSTSFINDPQRIESIQSRNVVHDKAVAGLSRANLKNSARKDYLSSVHRVLDAMPDSVVKTLSENISNMHFYGSNQELAKGLFDNDVLSVEQFPGGRLPRGAQIGGAFASAKHNEQYPATKRTGDLYLDGKNNKTRDAIYAHEFGHAMDHMKSGPLKDYTISQSREWQYAHLLEMSSGQLTRYATTNSSEGFAEFSSAMYNISPVARQQMKSLFPRSYQVFEQNGLIKE